MSNGQESMERRHQQQGNEEIDRRDDLALLFHRGGPDVLANSRARQNFSRHDNGSHPLTGATRAVPERKRWRGAWFHERCWHLSLARRGVASGGRCAWLLVRGRGARTHIVQ